MFQDPQYIKIINTQSEQENALYKELFNISHNESLEENIHKDLLQNKSKNFFTFKQEEKTQEKNQLDEQTIKKAEVQETKEQIIKIIQEKDPEEYKKMGEMVKCIIEPFLKEIQQLKNQLEFLKEDKKVEKKKPNEIQKKQIKEKKIVIKQDIKDDQNQLIVEQFKDNQQALQKQYDTLLNQLTSKVVKLKETKSSLENDQFIENQKKREIKAQIRNFKLKQLIEEVDYREELQYENFDITKFNRDLIKLESEYQKSKNEYQEVILNNEIIVPDVKSINNFKEQKKQESIIDLMKNKFGVKYEKFKSYVPTIQLEQKNKILKDIKTNFITKGPHKDYLQNIKTKPEQCEKIVKMVKLLPPKETLFIDTKKELEKLKDQIRQNDNEFFKMIALDTEVIQNNQDNTKKFEKKVLIQKNPLEESEQVLINQEDINQVSKQIKNSVQKNGLDIFENPSPEKKIILQKQQKSKQISQSLLLNDNDFFQVIQPSIKSVVKSEANIFDVQ